MNNLADASRMLEHEKSSKDYTQTYNMTVFYATYSSEDKTTNLNLENKQSTAIVHFLKVFTHKKNILHVNINTVQWCILHICSIYCILYVKGFYYNLSALRLLYSIFLYCLTYFSCFLVVNPSVLQLPSRCQVCIRKGVSDMYFHRHLDPVCTHASTSVQNVGQLTWIFTPHKN